MNTHARWPGRIPALVATLAVLVVASFPACSSCRDKPSELLDTQARNTAGVNPNQDTNKTDLLTGAAVADSDGDANQSNQKVGVDVQSPNQASGATFQFSPLLGGNAESAANILATTSPGEEATLRTLTRVQDGIESLETRLRDDVALTLPERTELENKLDAVSRKEALLIARLDKYSENKLRAAQALMPDLGALRNIVYQIHSNQTAGNDAPNISDAQAESIARTAEKALEYSPLGGDTDPAPAPGE